MDLDVPHRNGCWSAWADPRAVYKKNNTFVGYVDSNGSVKVYSYDHTTENEYETTLHRNFLIDDHANPTILIRNEDNRIICFWDRSGDIYYSISEEPLDISNFGPIHTLDALCGNYASPIQLEVENNRIFLFYRDGPDKNDRWRHHVYRYSDDGGRSWSDPHTFLDFGRLYGNNRRRVYSKVTKDSDQTIHFTLSSHPHHDPPHDIYYMKYKNEKFYTSDDVLIGDKNDFPFKENDLETVWEYSNSARKGWVFDISSINKSPVIVFATYPQELMPASGKLRQLGPLIKKSYSKFSFLPFNRDILLNSLYQNFVNMAYDSSDHYYHYAYLENETNNWITKKITNAGGSIATDAFREPCYSGGITLNHKDPREVYFSRQVGDNRFRIEKARTENQGDSWVFETITSGNTKDGRPVGVRNFHPDIELVFWSGDYYQYRNYNTTVKSSPQISISQEESS